MTTTSPAPKARTIFDDWTWRPEHFENAFGQRLPGKFQENWPEDKRIAVLLTFDTQGDIDAAVPGPWSGFQPGLEHRINYCDVTMRQYDIRAGLPRILRILDKHGVKGTFPTSGMTCDWYPDEIREIVDQGHELAVHGYCHVLMIQLTPEEERFEIERATEAAAKILGEAPKGWRTPVYLVTEETVDIVRDNGYEWLSDFHDGDFPYVLSKDNRDIVSIPVGHDDWSMFLQGGPGNVQMGGTPYGTADGALSTLKAEFDVLYEESADSPQMFMYAMHPTITGRPFRAAVMDRLIEYMKGHDGVWFCTCDELASLAY